MTGPEHEHGHEHEHDDDSTPEPVVCRLRFGGERASAADLGQLDRVSVMRLDAVGRVRLPVHAGYMCLFGAGPGGQLATATCPTPQMLEVLRARGADAHPGCPLCADWAAIQRLDRDRYAAAADEVAAIRELPVLLIDGAAVPPEPPEPDVAFAGIVGDDDEPVLGPVPSPSEMAGKLRRAGFPLSRHWDEAGVEW